MDTGGFFVALFKKVKPLSPDADARMHQLARESRGGIEVDAHLNKESNDVEMTETEDGNEESILKKREDDEVNRKAPTGKIGQYHNRKKNDAEDAEPENDEVGEAEQAPIVHNKKKKKEHNDLSNEDFVPIYESIWPPIVEQFGLGPGFPKEQYMARAAGVRPDVLLTVIVQDGLGLANLRALEPEVPVHLQGNGTHEPPHRERDWLSGGQNVPRDHQLVGAGLDEGG